MKLTKSYREILCVSTSLFISPQNLIPAHNKSDTIHHTKRILSHFIVFLIISFYPFMIGLAQQSGAIKNEPNKPVDLTATGIQIGQQVPDIFITNIHNYKSTSARISDFRGKLLILDFWATWCSPCVAMIPRMDSLQKEFGDKVQFLSVTYQKESEALPFLEKFEKQKGKHYDIPVITNDSVLTRLFPHRVLPHYIWIGPDGVTRAITGLEEISVTNVAELLHGKTGNLKQKIDFSLGYDESRPLFYSDSLTKGRILKQSTFSPFIPGLDRGFNQTIPVDDNRPYKRITVRNYTIEELFRLANGKEEKETVIESSSVIAIRQVKKGTDLEEWFQANGNAYCYELVIDSADRKMAFGMFRNDLTAFFPQLEAVKEKRVTRCLCLVRTSSKDGIKTKGGTPAVETTQFGLKLTSCYPRVFIRRMQYYLQNHPLPLADETGYPGMMDLDLQCNLSNVDELNKALARYDLRLVEKDAQIEMLIIKDRSNKSSK